MKAKGQAIKIPNISNLSANVKAADTDVTTQTVTETAVTLNVDKWYESSFEIEDMAAVQSNYDLRSEYSEKAGFGESRRSFNGQPLSKNGRIRWNSKKLDNTEPSLIRGRCNDYAPNILYG